MFGTVKGGILSVCYTIRFNSVIYCNYQYNKARVMHYTSITAQLQDLQFMVLEYEVLSNLLKTIFSIILFLQYSSGCSIISCCLRKKKKLYLKIWMPSDKNFIFKNIHKKILFQFLIYTYVVQNTYTV